ncbi:MAG: 30S ribosomal protein S12 methylthiotransferase RimO [Ferrimicrobium sp.]
MKTYWIETLGCAKNTVDSDRVAASLEYRGYIEAPSPEEASVVVVNTCAFIDAAREESVETILDLGERRSPGSQLIVTGCMAQRYGSELADALPEVDLVTSFGVDVGAVASSGSTVSLGHTIARRRFLTPSMADVPAMDLLNYAGRSRGGSYSYVKVAEGCNRHCGFCVIPSFRGRQESREFDALVQEATSLGSPEVILIAQDLANYGIDLYGARRLSELYSAIAQSVPWVRLLYLYPTGVGPDLLSAILDSAVPYVDLSMQHVSAPLLRRMRRVGSLERSLERIADIRRRSPQAALRSSFIVGYPGETDSDHSELLRFIDEAELDWIGLFPFSNEAGSFAEKLPDQVSRELALYRLNEASELQDRVLRQRQASQVGRSFTVLADTTTQARSYREAPEIDGVIHLDRPVDAGSFVEVTVTASEGPDLYARVESAKMRRSTVSVVQALSK